MIDNNIMLMSIPISKTIVSKKRICFRECAALIELARKNECIIYIQNNNSVGSTNSIYSLINLKIDIGSVITITIEGKNIRGAFHDSLKIFKIEKK